jgi:hypothetical protein
MIIRPVRFARERTSELEPGILISTNDFLGLLDANLDSPVNIFAIDYEPKIHFDLREFFGDKLQKDITLNFPVTGSINQLRSK